MWGFGSVGSLVPNAQNHSGFSIMHNTTDLPSNNTSELPLHNDRQLLAYNGILRAYQQDPLNPWIRDIMFDGELSDGPSNKDFLTMTAQENPFVLLKDIGTLQTGTEAFNAISAFATVYSVHKMWESTLNALKSQFTADTRIDEAVRRWDSRTPLYIYPHANTKIANITTDQAFYQPLQSTGKRALRFFKFSGLNGTIISAGESAEVISHEAGHAVLDVLKPNFLKGITPSLTFHEAFSDLSSLLYTLSQKNLVERWLNETGGDLHSDKNFVAQMAEQWGKLSGGRSKGLRNLDENMSIQDLLSNEPHYVSQLFTSIFYDALVDSAKEIGGSSLTVDIVQTTATSMRKALLWSIIHSSDDTISFQAAYNGMIAAFAAQPVMPNAYILARKLSDIFVQRIFPSAASQPGLPQPTPPAPVQTTKAPVIPSSSVPLPCSCPCSIQGSSGQTIVYPAPAPLSGLPLSSLPQGPFGQKAFPPSGLPLKPVPVPTPFPGSIRQKIVSSPTAWQPGLTYPLPQGSFGQNAFPASGLPLNPTPVPTPFPGSIGQTIVYPPIAWQRGLPRSIVPPSTTWQPSLSYPLPQGSFGQSAFPPSGQTLSPAPFPGQVRSG